MKVSFSVRDCRPTINLPAEMLEHVYMYCTGGCLSKEEIRALYTCAVLQGMGQHTRRELVHHLLTSTCRLQLP